MRVNPLKGMTTAELLQRIEAVGGKASPSVLLPGDFVRVEQGLQDVLAAVS